MSIIKLKIARNRYASEDNPTRFFILLRGGKDVVGLCLNRKRIVRFGRDDKRDLEARGWERSHMVVAEIDIPSIDDLDKLYETLTQPTPPA